MRARIALAGWVGVGLMAACNTILPPSSTPTSVAVAEILRSDSAVTRFQGSVVIVKGG